MNIPTLKLKPVNFSSVETHSQKCHITVPSFSHLNIGIGDRVHLKLNSGEIICRAFPLPRIMEISANENFVCANFTEERKNERCLGEVELKKLSSVPLMHIKVEILLTSIKNLAKWKNPCRNSMLASAIISQYDLITGGIIKCIGHPLANLYSVHQVNILETYTTCGQVGRLVPSTKVEICRIISIEQYDQLLAFKNIQIIGQESTISYIKQLLDFSDLYSKITMESSYISGGVLIVGPKGCGKTSLVKRLAFDCKAYLVILEETCLINMTSDEVKDYLEEILRSVSAYSGTCIFLFDDIDKLCSTKKNDITELSHILRLFNEMRRKNICIIGTAVAANAVHQAVITTGFFKIKIQIDVPTCEQREEILKSIIPTSDLNPSLDLRIIAKKTRGYVGADIISLYKEAKSLQEKRITQSGAHEILTSTITTNDFEESMLVVKSSVVICAPKSWNLNVEPIRWDDIGGMAKIKERLRMSIEWPLLHPHAFAKVRLSCPRGLLLCGPPGCCKTTLVRALATECNASFLSASPADIYSSYVGDSEQAIFQIFRLAKQCAPSIIFFDELDSLVGKRAFKSKNRDIHEKVLSAMLNEMDGIGINCNVLMETDETEMFNGKRTSQKFSSKSYSDQSVVVVGATNRPDFIDDALLRPGRFDTILRVPLPNKEERENILKNIMKKMPIQDVDLSWLSQNTEGFSGADLKNLCHEAGYCVLREELSVKWIKKRHFENALKNATAIRSETEKVKSETF